MNTYLLAQHLYGQMASADSLRKAARVRLTVILSGDEALRDLGIFDFVALHLFYAGGRHTEVVAELLRLIERTEELHTEVQGVIKYPHLAATLLYDI